MVTKAFLKKCILRVSVPLLPLSIGFLAVGITLLLLGSLSVPRFVFSVPALVSGCFLWYAGMYLKNRARFFFAATFLALAGCLLFFIDTGLVQLRLPTAWPLLMLFVGCAFSVSGYLNYRKLHAVYIAPAFVFAGLGFFFLLFTSRVITLSFTAVVIWWFPLLLLPSILSVAIWVFRKGKKGDRESDE